MESTRLVQAGMARKVEGVVWRLLWRFQPHDWGGDSHAEKE